MQMANIKNALMSMIGLSKVQWGWRTHSSLLVYTQLYGYGLECRFQ